MVVVSVVVGLAGDGVTKADADGEVLVVDDALLGAGQAPAVTGEGRVPVWRAPVP